MKKQASGQERGGSARGHAALLASMLGMDPTTASSLQITPRPSESVGHIHSLCRSNAPGSTCLSSQKFRTSGESMAVYPMSMNIAPPPGNWGWVAG